MARGVRKDTPDRIAAARERDPLALGPWFGQVAVMHNVTAGIVARIVNTHEQTVLRWFFGISPMSPQWLKAAAPLIALLAWMQSTKKEPLRGSIDEKIAQLKKYRAEFAELAKAAA